jgi:predicted transcriptional regulator
MKAMEKSLARELRRQGHSVKEIAKQLGVSRGTVSCGFVTSS